MMDCATCVLSATVSAKQRLAEHTFTLDGKVKRLRSPTSKPQPFVGGETFPPSGRSLPRWGGGKDRRPNGAGSRPRPPGRRALRRRLRRPAPGPPAPFRGAVDGRAGAGGPSRAAAPGGHGGRPPSRLRPRRAGAARGGGPGRAGAGQAAAVVRDCRVSARRREPPAAAAVVGGEGRGGLTRGHSRDEFTGRALPPAG